MSVSEQDVLRALSAIEDPDLHRDIVSLGFVQKPEIDGDVVNVRIVLTTPACPVREKIETDARDLLLALPGVREANVTMEANVAQHGPGQQKPIEGVRNIIAVASNKGGVGKSHRLDEPRGRAGVARRARRACSTPTSPARTSRR